MTRADLAWFEFLWECYCFALAASPTSPRYADRAREIYQSAQEAGFEPLRNRGEAGARLAKMFALNPPTGS